MEGHYTWIYPRVTLDGRRSLASISLAILVMFHFGSKESRTVRVNIAVCTQTQRQDAYWRALHPPPPSLRESAATYPSTRRRRRSHVYVLATAYIISLHSKRVWHVACCAYPKLATSARFVFPRSCLMPKCVVRANIALQMRFYRTWREICRLYILKRTHLRYHAWPLQIVISIKIYKWHSQLLLPITRFSTVMTHEYRLVKKLHAGLHYMICNNILSLLPIITVFRFLSCWKYRE